MAGSENREGDKPQGRIAGQWRSWTRIETLSPSTESDYGAHHTIFSGGLNLKYINCAILSHGGKRIFAPTR